MSKKKIEKIVMIIVNVLSVLVIISIYIANQNPFKHIDTNDIPSEIYEWNENNKHVDKAMILFLLDGDIYVKYTTQRHVNIDYPIYDGKFKIKFKNIQTVKPNHINIDVYSKYKLTTLATINYAINSTVNAIIQVIEDIKSLFVDNSGYMSITSGAGYTEHASQYAKLKKPITIHEGYTISINNEELESNQFQIINLNP